MTEPAPAEQRVQTVCLFILSTVAVGGALYWLSPVLIPFVLAIFFTYCLTPVIDIQTQYLRIPRSLAVFATVVVGCVVLVLFGMVVSTSASELSAHTDDYQARITQLMEQMTAAVPLERWGVRLEDFTEKVSSITQEMVTRALTATVSGIMSIFSNGAMVLIFMIFMLIGKQAGTASAGGLLHDVEVQIKRYILTMVFISGTTGVLVGFTLWFLGVEFAWMFGFLAFLLNFIPNIGSLIATLLPLPVALMSPDLSVTVKVLAMALPGVLQFVIGNVVQPKVMGGSLDLHPVVVLLSLIFFGMIWGVVGMFLATPITAVAKMFLEKSRFTTPVAHLLAGRLDVLLTGPAPPNGCR